MKAANHLVMYNLNEKDCYDPNDLRRPPIGIKPCIFCEPLDHKTRLSDLLDAVIRYQDFNGNPLPIWFYEIYARYLVPNSIMTNFQYLEPCVVFSFENKMKVTIQLHDPVVMSKVDQLVAAHKLICSQRQ